MKKLISLAAGAGLLLTAGAASAAREISFFMLPLLFVSLFLFLRSFLSLFAPPP